MPSARNAVGEELCAVSSSGATGIGCSDKRDGAEPAALAPAQARACRVECDLVARRDAIGKERLDLGERDRRGERMRPAAALPVSSATARNGSRASGEAASSCAPRPLASRNAPGAAAATFWRCVRDRRARAGRRRRFLAFRFAADAANGSSRSPPSAPPWRAHRARAARAVAAQRVQPRAQIDVVAAEAALADDRGDLGGAQRRAFARPHPPPCAQAAAAAAAGADAGLRR